MMSARLVMAAMILASVGALPPPRATSPPPPIRLGPVLFPGVGEDMKTAASELRPSRATIDCGRTDGVEERSCNHRCRLLPEKYEGGDCVEGRCHCKKEAEKITCKESCPTHCKSLGQEGQCVEGVCHCHDVELKCEHLGSCSSHCRTLGHTESQCHEGICRCGIDAARCEKSPAIKCEELVSVSEKRRNLDELCLNHCRTLEEGYRGGECEKGICRCSN